MECLPSRSSRDWYCLQVNKSSKTSFLQKKTSVPDNDLPPSCAIHPPPCNYLPRRLPNMNYIERFPCTLLPTGFFQQRILAGNEKWWGEAASSPDEVTFRPNGITTQLQLVLSIPNISSYVDHPSEINCPWWMGVPSTLFMTLTDISR